MKIREPNCNREDCFACKHGKCVVLNKNNFGGRECPFFKSNEQVAKEKELYPTIFKED